MTENFTSYVETDPNSHITVTSSSKIDFSSLPRNEDAYVYKDFGANFFSGNIELLFEVSLASGDNFCHFNITWANAVDDISGIDTANGDALNVLLYKNNSTTAGIQVRELDAGTFYNGTAYVSLSLSTTYYCKFVRDDNAGTYGTIYLYTYTDSARTNLIDTQSVALHTSKKDFRYFYALQTNNSGHTNQGTGFFQNFDGTVGFPTTYSYSAAGGFVLGGSAAYSTEGGVAYGSYTYNPSGGIIFGGEAVFIRETVITASGGVIFGGSADVKFPNYTYFPEGGFVFGGSADVVQWNVQVFSHTGSGGFVIGGTAPVNDHRALYSYTAQGGFIFGGEARVISSALVKILAIGHSIVKGSGDTDETRPFSENYTHIPEGGWNLHYGEFGDRLFDFIAPRWGSHDNTLYDPYWPWTSPSTSTDGSGGWVVRAVDFIPNRQIQVWNEAWSGCIALDYDPSGSNNIGAIFSRVSEPLPSDLKYAVYAMMANETTSKALWKAQTERIVLNLRGRGIETILVKDFYNGSTDHTARYNDYSAAIDELITTYGLPPALDLYTPSYADFTGSKVFYTGDNVHPNVNGHIWLASMLTNYLIQNGIINPRPYAMELFWGVFNSGTGVIRSAPFVKAWIRRRSDGYLYDFNSESFKASGWGLAYTNLCELDSVNLRGYYSRWVRIKDWQEGEYDIIYRHDTTPYANEVQTVYVKGDIVFEAYVSNNIAGTWTDTEKRQIRHRIGIDGYVDTPALRTPNLGYAQEADYTSTRAAKLDNLDAAMTTRLATASYTAPDNAGIAAIQAETITHPTLNEMEASEPLTNGEKRIYTE